MRGDNKHMETKIRRSAKQNRNSAIVRAVNKHKCSFYTLSLVSGMNSKTIAEIYYRERARGGFSVPKWVLKKYPNLNLSTD